MKKIFILIATILPTTLFAQLTISNGNIFMQQNAVLTVDSLILKPSSDQSIGNTILTHTNTPVPVPSGNTINAVYNFTNPITFSGQVQMRYSNAQLNGNTASNLQITHKATSASTWIVTSGSVVDLSAQLVSQTISNTALSSVSATSAGSALPIDLVRFDVVKTNDGNASDIEWEVAHPEQCSHFVVERSADSKNFESIGTVQATSENVYNFIDKNPIPSWNYYRLKTTEPTMEVSYSEVKKLLFEKTNSEIKVFPNPASSQVTLFTTDQSLMQTDAYVSDVQGRIIHRFKINAESTALNVSHWTVGVYIIKLSNGQNFKIQKL